MNDTNTELIVLEMTDGTEFRGSVRMKANVLQIATFFGQFSFDPESARTFCNTILNHLIQGSPNKLK